MRTIDADALEFFEFPESNALEDYHDGWNEAIKEVRGIIAAAPTVVPSVPEGKWLPRTDYNGSLWWKCSVCGYTTDDDYMPLRYCPECGAYMEDVKCGI